MIRVYTRVYHAHTHTSFRETFVRQIVCLVESDKTRLTYYYILSNHYICIYVCAILAIYSLYILHMYTCLDNF